MNANIKMSIAGAAEPGPIRQGIAKTCGVIAAVCAGLFFLVLALHLIAALAGKVDNEQENGAPLLLFIIIMFTFPPVALCAVVVVACVGFRRARLAWASLAACYGVPCVIYVTLLGLRSVVNWK